MTAKRPPTLTLVPSGTRGKAARSLLLPASKRKPRPVSACRVEDDLADAVSENADPVEPSILVPGVYNVPGEPVRGPKEYLAYNDKGRYMMGTYPQLIEWLDDQGLTGFPPPVRVRR